MVRGQNARGRKSKYRGKKRDGKFKELRLLPETNSTKSMAAYGHRILTEKTLSLCEGRFSKKILTNSLPKKILGERGLL